MPEQATLNQNAAADFAHAVAVLAGEKDGGAANAWLAEALACARRAGADPQRFYDRHAGVARALRGSGWPMQLGAAERALLRSYGVGDGDNWSAVDLVRAALVLEALGSLPGAEQVVFLRRLYQKGDVDEQRLVLRALVLLPQAEQFLALALEGCRSNVRAVFEAIACDNGYALRYFPDPNFYQLVLKALFIEVPAGRITGLAQRHSAQLTRMVGDYAAERRAAARPVSHDVQCLLAGMTPTFQHLGNER